GVNRVPRSSVCTSTFMSEVIANVPDGQVMADLDGAVQWAGANGGDLQKPAISGFCWGGCITRLYAAPILKAPVLGLYGEKDGGMPLDTIGKMNIALGDGSAAAEGAEFVVYPDAPHAFYADYRPSYRKEAAQDGWRSMLAWFRQHGVA
ncbi:MAG: dienelactone hydrolase family protein, partial [Proteobacteria bacterium]|nr:dienelactone hydrolase family protein [Pseudomonadota bacterium]